MLKKKKDIYPIVYHISTKNLSVYNEGRGTYWLTDEKVQKKHVVKIESLEEDRDWVFVKENI